LPVGTSLSALLTLVVMAALLTGLIAYEALRYSDSRERIRHQLGRDPLAD
jgi:hypothetical protein